MRSENKDGSVFGTHTPKEPVNVIDHPAYADVAADLRERLLS